MHCQQRQHRQRQTDSQCMQVLQLHRLPHKTFRSMQSLALPSAVKHRQSEHSLSCKDLAFRRQNSTWLTLAKKQCMHSVRSDMRFVPRRILETRFFLRKPGKVVSAHTLSVPLLFQSRHSTATGGQEWVSAHTASESILCEYALEAHHTLIAP